MRPCSVPRRPEPEFPAFQRFLSLRNLSATLPPWRHCLRCRIPDLGRFRCRRRRETPGCKTGTDCGSTNFDTAIGSGLRNDRRLRRRDANSPKSMGSAPSATRPPAWCCWGLRHIHAPTKVKTAICRSSTRTAYHIYTNSPFKRYATIYRSIRILPVAGRHISAASSGLSPARAYTFPEGPADIPQSMGTSWIARFRSSGTSITM